MYHNTNPGWEVLLITVLYHSLNYSRRNKNWDKIFPRVWKDQTAASLRESGHPQQVKNPICHLSTAFMELKHFFLKVSSVLPFTGTGQHKITEYSCNYVPSFLELSDQIMFSSPAIDVKNYGPPWQVRCSVNCVSYLTHPLGAPESPSVTQRPCQYYNWLEALKKKY